MRSESQTATRRTSAHRRWGGGTTTLRRSIASVAFAAPVALLLAACGVPADLTVGESAGISGGSLTITSIEERPASDLVDIELDELEGQTPYFVHYEVEFDGADDSLDRSLWKGSASSGEVTPLNIIDIGGNFDCNPTGDVTEGQAEGCQLLMVESGATLESVGYGAAGRWTVSDS
ncbi:hypothetical protein N1028_14415 [Herbiconiux sp. CPCC 203407]|uniref:Uncharacterized protein n=1 Tax=Herbiconiux oxytropis TaxID=2970915 RepID=A0AA41XJ71_9MICO|nr:hypothetical protein [Herbiconiux oxytropis]MCS5722272.1 hypothetical protein [Herbiconiux oxytropis]MCS5727090.1 hypothetical protein [Herbiconiux oxytropis]